MHGSRPKTIDDVSAQDHTIAVLQKTLTSTNVPCIYTKASNSVDSICFIAPAYVILWSSRDRQNFYNPRLIEATLRVCVSIINYTRYLIVSFTKDQIIFVTVSWS